MHKQYLYFTFLLLLQIQLFAQGNRHFKFPSGIQAQDYSANKIIFKIVDPNTSVQLNSNKSQPIFDPASPPTSSKAIKMESLNSSVSRSSRGRVRPSKYLKNIYEITIENGANLEDEINQLLKYGNVIYAEPIYSEQLLFVPNDPQANPNSGNQAHLGVINAYNAWDIEQGSPDISIAVIDTGTDLDHPDLISNLLINLADPINGEDDDGDGLIDNFNGYDFAEDDNDPTADFSGHGVLVNGLSSATTNNGVGVAGTGFNSSFVPYKIFRSDNNISNNSYEAVLFAAQHHSVLNLSWGNNSFSQARQDIINAAVLEHDAVIVAAAGNTPIEIEFYPASYENVLSVASTSIDDTKSSFSTFSYNIDIAAPGTSNYTTKNGDTYGLTGGGTSFASPLVAGAAALLRAHFPEWTAQQVMEQLRVSSQDIYDVGSNQNFFGQLGKGRLDMFNALTSTNKSIRLLDFGYSDPFGQFAFYSDTLEISGQFENFLSPTTTPIATLSTQSSYATILTSEFDLGQLDTLQTIDFKNNPITILLSEDTPPDEQILIRIDYSDANYTDWQYIQFNTTPDNLNVGTNSVALTVSGNGDLGDAGSILNNGLGFIFDINEIASQLGLVIYADGKIVDNVVANFDSQVKEQDFTTTKNIRFFNNSTANQFGSSFFDDSNAGVNAVGLTIEQKVLTWDDISDQEYIILEYRISNNSGADISDLKLGLFTDWNINEVLDNKINWDQTNKLGYGFQASNPQIFGGAALLTSHTPLFFAIDKGSENGNTPDISNLFTKADKATFMTSGLSKTDAGSDGGNEVAQLIGAEVGTLLAGESTKIAFLLAASGNLSDLQDAVSQAKMRHTEFLNNPPVAVIDTTCINQTATISLSSGVNFNYYSDPLGQNLLHSGNDFETGVLDQVTTFYIQNIDQAFSTDIRSLKLVPLDIEPEVTFPTELLLLGDNPNNTIQFEDQTFKAASWLWDFDNGTGSTDDNPIAQFNSTGDYQVTLSVTNKFGCTAQYSKMLKVRERGDTPTFPEYEICPNESVSIMSNEANRLKVYAALDSVTPIAEGTSFNPEFLISDTTFFISNVDEEFESIKVPVFISVIVLIPNFNIHLDSLDLSKQSLLHLENASIGATSFKWTVNGEVVESIHPTIDFNGLTEINIEIEISNAEGCTTSKQIILTPTQSIRPKSSEISICGGISYTIKPQGGTFFHFYSHAGLEHIIKKGKSFETGLLTRDTSFFVTSMDQLLESEAEEFQITVIPESAEFDMEPNPLIIENGNQVQFTDRSFSPLDWEWFVNDQLVEVVQNPTLFFDSVGSHIIKLRISNSAGCTFEKTRTLEVKAITGIQQDLKSYSKLYPNPVSDELIIDLQENVNQQVSIEVFDLSGKRQIRSDLKSSINSIDMQLLLPGIYAVILKGEGWIENHRIIVQ